MTEISSLCVFCGSKMGNDPAYGAAAEHLGREVAERNLRLIYGGGGIGLMGATVEAALALGGKVTGVIPEFLMQYEVGKPDIEELIVVESMFLRKKAMFELSDAFVILPGGLGTLDEAFEVITWKQLQLHAKPVVVANINGYWGNFGNLISHCVEGGFAHPGVSELFTMVDDVDQIFDAIASAPEPKVEVLLDHL